jgi:hypothetical protein
MRKWLAGLVVWLLRVLLGAKLEGPELDGVRCCRCQNFFWVTDAHIEPPAFCAYCGTRFTGHRKVTGADFDLGN